MTKESLQPFCLNGHRVDPGLGKVARNGVEHHLEPRVMQVLCYLAHRPGQLIAREELFAALWHRSVVHEMALTRCVTQIRKVFDDTRPHRVIETIPKKGYRFAGQITNIEDDTTPDFTSRWLAATAATLIVAVLVVSTTSQGTGGTDRPAQADNGPVRNDAATVYYERGRALAKQRTRETVAESIEWFRRAIDERPGYSEAHSALSNALSLQAFYWQEATLSEAELHAELAVELNPLSAQAFNSRGLVYAIRGKSDEAIAESERALALDPDYWQAAHHLANVYYNTNHLDLAAHWYTRTLEMNPDNTSAIGHLGEIYLRLGDLVQAGQLLDRAWELDPGNRIVIRSFANLRLIVGDTAAALESCSGLLEHLPWDFRCLQYSALASLLSGELDQARQFNARLEKANPGHLYTDLIRAQTEMYAGQPDRAEEILADVERRAKSAIEEQGNLWYLSWSIAAVQSLRGNVDQAMQWLDKSLEAGRTFWLWDDYDPALAPLHSDPRFNRYIDAMRVKTDLTRENLRDAI